MKIYFAGSIRDDRKDRISGNQMKIVRSEPSHATTLTAIAIAAKKYWGYSDEQIERWKPDLTISREEIQEGFTFHLEKNMCSVIEDCKEYEKEV